MKDLVPKDSSKASSAGNAEHTKEHAQSTQLLTKKSSFGWAKALLIAIPLALVGIFIVFNTFAATASQTYVIGLYDGLLGRKNVPATDKGVDFWAKQIDSGKATKAAVYTAIYNTNEAKAWREKLVKAGYGTASYTPPGQTPAPNKAAPNKPVQPAATAEQCVTNAYKPKAPDAKGKAFWVAQIAKGKTCAEVTSRIQGLLTASTTSRTSSRTNSPKLTPAQCDKKLRKEFRVPEYDKPEKHVGTWLKNQYIRYQGYAAGYRSGQNPKGAGDLGWELGDEGTALLKDVVFCEKTSAQALDIIKSGEGAKKWTAEKQAYFESYEKPIAKVYQDVLRAAIQASGRNYTCWYTSKKTGKQVDMLTDPEYANTIPFYGCFTDIGLPKPPSATGVDLVALYAAGKIDLAGAAQAIQGGAVGVCEEPSENPFAPNTPQPASCGGGSATYTQQELQQAVSEASSQQAEESGAQQSSRGFGAASGTMTNSR